MINSQAFEKIIFYLLLLVFLAGAILRAGFFDFSDFDYGVYSDHFINAVTAKNISIGLGWSSSGYESYLLNPENLTVGPTVVLPVTIAIVAFGNKLAVPGLAILILNLFILLLVLRSLKKLHGKNIPFYLCAFLLIFLFMFFKSYYWYRMIGEVSAILLLLLVIIYLSHYLQTFDTRSLFIASIAAAFAMGTKELVLLPVVAITILVVYVSYSSPKKTSGGYVFWLGRPLLFLFICLTLPALFFFYRNTLLHTQTEVWRTAYFAYANGIHDYYSGINTLREYLSSPEQTMNIFQRVIKSTLWNGGTLLHLSYVGMRGLQYWLCIFVVVVVFIFASRNFTSLHSLLALSATPLLLWFFCISEKAMPRHLYIGLFLAVLACLFYLASIKNAVLRYTFVTLALVLIVLTGDQSSRFVLKSFPYKASNQFVAVNDIQKYIEKQPERSLAWIGMIDNNEFEYLSRSPNNFINGFDLIADSITLNEPAYLASHPHVKKLIDDGEYVSAFDYYTSRENTRPEAASVTFIKPIEFHWLHFKGEIVRHYRTNIHMDKGELCKAITYQNEYYVVEHCFADDIQAFFDLNGGLPFRPRKWRPYILLPSERAELF